MNYKELTTNDLASLPASDIINALRLDLDVRIDTNVYIFRNITGSLSCVMQSVQGTGKLPNISGLNITHETFGVSGERKKPYIHLECTFPAYHNNFSLLIKEILADYDTSTTDMSKSVNKIISKWKHFFSEPTNELLPEDEVIGLLGELILLNRLSQILGSESIDTWTADRGEEDFIRGNNVVEVKSTLKERHEHIINGIDQLLVLPNRRKHILSILLIRSAANDYLTLPKLIRAISDNVQDTPHTYKSFLSKLHNRGYDPRDVNEYEHCKYQVVRGCFFLVNDSFPKLTSDELIMPLSPRISKVRYLVDLEGITSVDFVDCQDDVLRYILNL